MLRLLGPGVRLCDGWNRREVMRIGGLGVLGAGLNLSDLRRSSRAEGSRRRPPFGRAKSCIVLFLMGGPPQHSTWDPKPDAPAEVRGEFGPIATTVPGLSLCELLPRTALVADKLCRPAGHVHRRQRPLLQRLLHADGAAPPADELRERQPGAAERLAQPGGRARTDRQGRRRAAPRGHAAAPDLQHRRQRLAGPGCRVPGPDRRPLAAECPADAGGIPHPGDRPARRPRPRAAWATEGPARPHPRGLEPWIAWPTAATFDEHARQAFDLLGSSQARRAFRLEEEPEASRDRYGDTPFGQSVLLARRLVEAGVRLVQVNWYRGPDEPPGQPLLGQPRQGIRPAQGRAGAARRIGPSRRCSRTWTGVACWTRRWSSAWPSSAAPPGWTATAAAATGARSSRSRWRAAASGGARVRLVGPDRGLPREGRVRPEDLSATIFHCLGYAPQTEYQDPLGRPTRSAGARSSTPSCKDIGLLHKRSVKPFLPG